MNLVIASQNNQVVYLTYFLVFQTFQAKKSNTTSIDRICQLLVQAVLSLLYKAHDQLHIHYYPSKESTIEDFNLARTFWQMFIPQLNKSRFLFCKLKCQFKALNREGFNLARMFCWMFIPHLNKSVNSKHFKLKDLTSKKCNQN